MNFYKGKDNDILIGNFRYVKEKADGGEKHNFNPWTVNGKEVCYGFVEPGFTKGGYENGRQRQMHIQKINNAGKPGESLDNVLVVWCTKLPESRNTVIVGWYKDAVVFRNINTLPYDKEKDRGLSEFGYWYNVVADKENCVLLPIEERKKDKWRAYRKKQNPNNFGFGQSNMWYATEKTDKEYITTRNAKEYVETIIKEVKEYDGENWV